MDVHGAAAAHTDLVQPSTTAAVAEEGPADMSIDSVGDALRLLRWCVPSSIISCDYACSPPAVHVRIGSIDDADDARRIMGSCACQLFVVMTSSVSASGPLPSEIELAVAAGDNARAALTLREVRRVLPEATIEFIRVGHAVGAGCCRVLISESTAGTAMPLLSRVYTRTQYSLPTYTFASTALVWRAPGSEVQRVHAGHAAVVMIPESARGRADGVIVDREEHDSLLVPPGEPRRSTLSGYIRASDTSVYWVSTGHNVSINLAAVNAQHPRRVLVMDPRSCATQPAQSPSFDMIYSSSVLPFDGFAATSVPRMQAAVADVALFECNVPADSHSSTLVEIPSLNFTQPLPVGRTTVPLAAPPAWPALCTDVVRFLGSNAGPSTERTLRVCGFAERGVVRGGDRCVEIVYLALPIAGASPFEGDSGGPVYLSHDSGTPQLHSFIKARTRATRLAAFPAPPIPLDPDVYFELTPAHFALEQAYALLGRDAGVTSFSRPESA